MSRFTLCLIALSPFAAFAQVQVQIDVPLPSVRFEAAPPLVVVEPGVQVVPDQGEETFFVDGFYWTRHDGRWFRSHDHRGGWVVVEERRVPQALVRIPPGKYRLWHAEREMRREERHDEHARERFEKHEEKHEEKEHRKNHDRDDR